MSNFNRLTAILISALIAAAVVLFTDVSNWEWLENNQWGNGLLKWLTFAIGSFVGISIGSRPRRKSEPDPNELIRCIHCKRMLDSYAHNAHYALGCEKAEEIYPTPH